MLIVSKTSEIGIGANGKSAETQTVTFSSPDNRAPETLREKLTREGLLQELAIQENDSMMAHHLDDPVGSSSRVSKFTVTLNGGIVQADEVQGRRLKDEAIRAAKARKQVIS